MHRIRAYNIFVFVSFGGGGAVADPELFVGGLTIRQHPQLSSDYEEDYVIRIRRPKFRGGAAAPLAPLGSATGGSPPPPSGRGGGGSTLWTFREPSSTIK